MQGRGTVVVEAPSHVRTLYDELSESERTLRDVAELRETIEPKFAQLAAERATRATLYALERVLETSGRELSRPESLEADISFHMLLAQASRNPLLVALNSLANSWTASVRSYSHETAEARDAMLAHLADVAQSTRGNYPSF